MEHSPWHGPSNKMRTYIDATKKDLVYGKAVLAVNIAGKAL